MSQNSTNTQNSAEVVAANEDLLTEILLHLPIKSLLRFKCVSTKWLNLISSTYFSINHTLKNSKKTTSMSGLFMYQYPSIFYLSLGSSQNSLPSFGPVPALEFLKITPSAANVTILTSSNGLLLCLSVAPPCNTESGIIYFVCNPTTKKSNPLPPIEMLAQNPIVNMDLAFDPSESTEYRVLCIRHLNPPDGPEFGIQVYSSVLGSWKTCRGGPFLDIPKGIQFRGGVYWNKSIHYLNSWGGDSLYFSFEDEKLKSLQMPPMQSEIHTIKRSWYLGRTGSGSLNLVDIQTNITRDSTIDVYEVRSDYSGWVIRYRVGLSAIEAVHPEIVQYFEAQCNRNRVGRYYTYSVLSLVQREGGDGDLVEIVLSIQNKIICYNPKRNVSKVLVYFGDDRDRLAYEWDNVIHYTETLSPV